MRKLSTLACLLVISMPSVVAQSWNSIDVTHSVPAYTCGPYFRSNGSYYYGIGENNPEVKVLMSNGGMSFACAPVQYGGGVLGISRYSNGTDQEKLCITTSNGCTIKDLFDQQKSFPVGKGFWGQFGPDANSYVTTEQNSINIIDVASGAVKRSMKTKENVSRFAMSWDRQKIAVQGDKSLMVVSLDSLLIRNKHKKGAANSSRQGMSLAFSPDSKTIMFIGYKSDLNVWNLESNKVESVFVTDKTGKLITSYQGHIAMLADGLSFAIQYGNTVAICSTKELKVIDLVGDPKRMLQTFSIDPFGQRVLILYDDGLVEFYKM